jgi:hypothetical protein
MTDPWVEFCARSIVRFYGKFSHNLMWRGRFGRGLPQAGPAVQGLPDSHFCIFVTAAFDYLYGEN